MQIYPFIHPKDVFSEFLETMGYMKPEQLLSPRNLFIIFLTAKCTWFGSELSLFNVFLLLERPGSILSSLAPRWAPIYLSLSLSPKETQWNVFFSSLVLNKTGNIGSIEVYLKKNSEPYFPKVRREANTE